MMNQNWMEKREQWMERTRVFLRAYMGLHPKIRLAGWRYTFRNAVALATLAVLVVATSFGVAAKNSLPGEALYPLKIRIETIESAFLFSSQSKAVFEVQRTTIRLQEVATLAVQPKSTASAKREAAQRLEAQVKSATKQIAKIESGDGSKALETTVSLHATLQAHKEALSELAPKIDADAKVQVLAAVDTIEKSSDQVQKNVLDLQQQATTSDKAISQDDLKTKTVTALKEAQEELLRVQDDFDQESEDMKILLAQEALVVAEQQIANKNYLEAGLRIRTARQAMAEAKASAKTMEQLASVTTLPEASQSPSPLPSVSPSPSLSPQANPSPSVSATPLPSDAVPVISIEMASPTITLGEPLVFAVRASNPYKAPLVLQWNTSCQVDFAIDAYPESDNRICAAVMSELYIQPGDSYTWSFASPELLSFGNHMINVEVLGYGAVSYEINIVPHDETTPVLQNQ